MPHHKQYTREALRRRKKMASHARQQRISKRERKQNRLEFKLKQKRMAGFRFFLYRMTRIETSTAYSELKPGGQRKWTWYPRPKPGDLIKVPKPGYDWLYSMRFDQETQRYYIDHNKQADYLERKHKYVNRILRERERQEGHQIDRERREREDMEKKRNQGWKDPALYA